MIVSRMSAGFTSYQEQEKETAENTSRPFSDIKCRHDRVMKREVAYIQTGGERERKKVE